MNIKIKNNIRNDKLIINNTLTENIILLALYIVSYNTNSFKFINYYFIGK